MTAKRFILYEHKDNDYILDNPNVHLDFIEMLGDALTSEEVVDLLNALHEENEQLKNEVARAELIVNKLKNADYENHKKKIRELQEQNKELKKENNELKQQFILLLKKLGKKNVQCSFCEHGEHYSELVDGYYEPRFICHKKGQEYTQRSFCEDWKIMVKE